MYMVDMDDVHWDGGLLGERFEVCRQTMVPHMWTILSDVHESHAWANFEMAAGVGEGRGDGKPHGPPFNDGDFLKWLEALAQVYAVTRDPAIDAEMDRLIAVIAKAQREDGYLHTQKIIPQRRAAAGQNKQEFEDREHFETYNMGHLITTACVHYRVTGKTSLLDCARKAADYIDGLCKNVPQDLARNAICPSHYMGVVELYRVTREPRYLELARQLIEIRSLVPPEIASDHNQDRIAFRASTEAVGHAVRANYLYAGVADIVAEDGDASLLAPLRAIDRDVATQKLYVTGMTGAIYDGASPDGVDHTQHRFIKTIHQAYGRDYQLPNLTAYNETCATIGYGMWLWRMLTLTGEARYADLFEQTLYNGILPGISLEGKHYFYVNPLKKLNDFKVPLRWSRTRMPNIKSSFCCPPNVVRTIAEAHNYVYTLSPDTLWVHLYGASTLDTAWTDGARIRLRQETNYPWSGAIKLTIDEAPAREVALKLRVPGWIRPGGASIRINGQLSSATPLSALRNPQSSAPAPGAYATITRTFRPGDVVELALDFSPVLLESNPLVEETLDQVAVRNGPIVYCLESNDLPEGVRLTDVALPLAEPKRTFTAQHETISGAQVATLTTPAIALQRPAWTPDQLYREAAPTQMRPIHLKLVPYYAWGNRGDTEMTVWLPAR
ncbi:MAG: glycoside hydrolase family 127 protein [Opitutaceae bacterium]|nr:glycoside hydrolase family 127 protein [Opitutaceae bacterium]